MSKQVITARRSGAANGLPTGTQMFTFTAMGSATPSKLALVTPIIIDAFAGNGDQRVPVPILGFARAVATGPGVTFRTPEPGDLLGLAGVVALAGLGRRRLLRA